jgi:hypothetical protein
MYTENLAITSYRNPFPVLPFSMLSGRSTKDFTKEVQIALHLGAGNFDTDTKNVLIDVSLISRNKLYSKDKTPIPLDFRSNIGGIRPWWLLIISFKNVDMENHDFLSTFPINFIISSKF